MESREHITELVQQAMKGDHRAFNDLYLLTRDRAYFVAFSITKNEQDALDILQDSYLKAWQRINTLQKAEQFPAWLNQITSNTAKDFIKLRKPHLFQPAGDAEITPLDLQAEKDREYIPDAAMDTAETRRLIMEIIDDLPEDQRLCVLMYYYDDIPLKEIATALEVSYSTVMSRLALARRKISNGVEIIEKKGTKLYSAAPIPLLIWLLKHMTNESSKQLPPVILGSAAKAGGITAVITLPKIISGIAVVSVIVGGIIAAVKLPAKQRQADEIDTYTAVPTAATEAGTISIFLPPRPDFTQDGQTLPLLSSAYAPDSRSATVSAGLAAVQAPATDGNTQKNDHTIRSSSSTTRPSNGATYRSTGATTTTATTNFSAEQDRTQESAATKPTTTAATTTTTTTTLPKRTLTVTFTDSSAERTQTSRTETVTVFGAGSDTLTAPALTAMAGWTALGWTASTDLGASAQYAPGSTIPVSGNITYYGVYEKNVTYTFNANGGSPAPAPVDTLLRFNSAPGSHLTATPPVNMPPAPVRPGYTFAAWMDGNGYRYLPGEAVLYGNTSIKAVWTV